MDTCFENRTWKIGRALSLGLGPAWAHADTGTGMSQPGKNQAVLGRMCDVPFVGERDIVKARPSLSTRKRHPNKELLN